MKPEVPICNHAFLNSQLSTLRSSFESLETAACEEAGLRDCGTHGCRRGNWTRACRRLRATTRGSSIRPYCRGSCTWGTGTRGALKKKEKKSVWVVSEGDSCLEMVGTSDFRLYVRLCVRVFVCVFVCVRVCLCSRWNLARFYCLGIRLN